MVGEIIARCNGTDRSGAFDLARPLQWVGSFHSLVLYASKWTDVFLRRMLRLAGDKGVATFAASSGSGGASLIAIVVFVYRRIASRGSEMWLGLSIRAPRLLGHFLLGLLGQS